MGQAKQRGTYEERRASAAPITRVPARFVKQVARSREPSDRERNLVLRANRHRHYPGSIVLDQKAKTFTVNWSNNPRVNNGQRDVAEALVALNWRYVELKESKHAQD